MADIDVRAELERYKRGLGVGFKKNYFFVRVLFSDLRTSLTWNLITTNNMANVEQNTALQNIAQAIGFPSTFSKGNLDESSAYTEDHAWLGLAKGFQHLSYNIEQGPEVMKWRTHAKNATKGVITIDYYNDQWDVNYQFWRNYMREISNGREMKYPSEYQADVELTVFDPEMNAVKKHLYKRCYPLTIDDVDFQDDAKDLHTFKVTLTWQDLETEAGKNIKKSSRSRFKSTVSNLAGF